VKMLVCGLAVFLLAIGAPAVLLSEDTNEIGLSGVIDFDTVNDTLIEMSFLYGYFFLDYVEVGGTFELRNDDSQTFWQIGPMAEYNFDVGTEVVPFLGISAGYAQLNSDLPDGDVDAFVMGCRGGMKYFFAEYACASLAAVYELASADIYADTADLERRNLKIEWGLRFFF